MIIVAPEKNIETIQPSIPSITSDHAPLVVKMSPPPIINELLCIVHNRIHILPFDSPVQLRSDCYSCEVISTAKQLLYNNAVTNGRLMSHKGAKKATMNMSDIVKVFLIDLQISKIIIGNLYIPYCHDNEDEFYITWLQK